MTTAREIQTLAERGDLEALARLALAGEVTFTASFGEAVEAAIADGQWLGWRLGITGEGGWQFLVTGD